MSTRSNQATPTVQRSLSLADRLYSFVRPQSQRREERNGCTVEGELYFSNQKYTMAGFILNYTSRGALFRPCSRFILKSKDEPVSLAVRGHTVSALVRNTTQVGYGLMFYETLSPEMMAELARAELAAQSADSAD